jgi:hypothetical protein
MDRQIRDQSLELIVGLGRVGPAQPVVQLRKVDTAIASGNPQPLSDSLPICVGGSGSISRDRESRSLLHVGHGMTIRSAELSEAWLPRGDIAAPSYRCEEAMGLGLVKAEPYASILIKMPSVRRWRRR